MGADMTGETKYKYQVRNVAKDEPLGKYTTLYEARNVAKAYDDGTFSIRVIRLSDNQIVDDYEEA